MTSKEIRDTFFGTSPINDDKYLGTGGFGNLISSMLPTIYILAAFLLFVYMIVGGFMLISASGDSKQADAGKQALTNAIIGFVLIFASYWIIQIIEIITGIPIV